MKPVVKHVSVTAAVLLLGGAAAAALFAWSGAYNFAADDPHTAAVGAFIETMRERSIETRAAKLSPPDLGDEHRIVQGAGNYAAMCVGCHLAPGMGESELSKGLYPGPPNLSKEKVDARHAFWVIKHGVKASGMPAWGKSMGDEYVWNMAAFLQKLPGLDAEQYEAMVARSGGHHHDHGDDHDGDGHGAEAAATAPGTPTAGDAPSAAATGHAHADGKRHLHSPAGAGK